MKNDLTFRIHTSDVAETRGKHFGVFDKYWTKENEWETFESEIESGDLHADEAIRRAQELMSKHPNSMHIRSLLGALLWKAEYKGSAALVFESSYKLAISVIPKTFNGYIDWFNINNRPFLRIAHGYMLALMDQGDGSRALSIANKLLRWCPNDILSVRRLLGDIHLLKGNYQAALKQFLKDAEHLPTAWYSVALIVLRSGGFVSACTFLRKGICGNPYVAEALTGRTLLQDHLYWHGTNLGATEFALEYLNSAGNDWTDSEIDFIDWVFNSPEVLRERAELMDIHLALTVEHEPSKRDAWVKRLYSFVDSRIDDEVSKKLVGKISNRWREDILPWDRSGHRVPLAYRDKVTEPINSH